MNDLKNSYTLTVILLAVVIVALTGCSKTVQSNLKNTEASEIGRSDKISSGKAIKPTDGTGTLTGTVTDSATGEPLPNIVIEDVNRTWTGISDLNGQFTIILIKPGVYDVTCSDNYSRRYSIMDLKIHANSICELNFVMPSGYGNYAQEVKRFSPRSKESIKKLRSEKRRIAAEIRKQEIRLDENVLKSIPIQEMECMRVLSAPGKAGRSSNLSMYGSSTPPAFNNYATAQPFNTECYDRIYSNTFLDVASNPLSTFSIDVDAASYSNVRRFINQGSLPPKDAVRIEEMINYFTYDYPQPKGKHPFSITTELSSCPWNNDHRLVHIGLQGRKIPVEKLPPGNLVFLLDVSGSMNTPVKLPMLKAAFRLLIGQLRECDRVAIVVYAGSAGLVLESTPGNRKQDILDAIGKLHAGGSTAGGAGIHLAYKIAKENFMEEGNNRVILATDGDFNVGVSSNAELVRIIEEKRKQGIYLTVLGFGTGNLKDSRMEQLADKGNGNYAYIDNIHEARKVFVNEIGATLVTIAKDVKIQVEFNPAKVSAYRLVGYENRMLAKEDFNDDVKDAGEMGAGHSVTALYEIVPAGVDFKLPKVDDLKYQKTVVSSEAFDSDELMTVKLRYKPPEAFASLLLSVPIKESDDKMSYNFQFAAAVAEFGMLLRDSEFKENATYEEVIAHAKSAKGKDEEGYRAEFIRLVETCVMLVGSRQ